MDTIKGLALFATFVGVLTIFAMWVSLWEKCVGCRWSRCVVQYTTAMGRRLAFAHHGRGGGRRVVA
jgi:hypothetical protein